ncbi:UDP-4-amino-4,6-dideoxy-N-acetyl-beta-L-altrosamine N-acetyltransferase [Petrotoga sp. DB-2]
MESNNLIYFVNFFNLNSEYKNKIREWRNQWFVREKMINKSIISKKEHEEFMTNLSKEDMFYLFFFNRRPFGVASLKKFDSINYEYGQYLIKKDDFNSGLGIIMEYVIHNKFFKNNNDKKILCRTKTNNDKVIKIHNKFGYKDKKIIKINDENYLLQEINYNDWVSNKQNIKTTLEKIFKINLEEVTEWKES